MSHSNPHPPGWLCFLCPVVPVLELEITATLVVLHLACQHIANVVFLVSSAFLICLAVLHMDVTVLFRLFQDKKLISCLRCL